MIIPGLSELFALSSYFRYILKEILQLPTESSTKMINSFSVIRLVNIVSGSDANITTPCEMEIFNFLWLIWDH